MTEEDMQDTATITIYKLEKKSTQTQNRQTVPTEEQPKQQQTPGDSLLKPQNEVVDAK